MKFKKGFMLSLLVLPLTLGSNNINNSLNNNYISIEKPLKVNNSIKKLQEGQVRSKYTNLIGNTVYYRSVTLKNTYHYHKIPYEDSYGPTTNLCPENTYYNLIFTIDNNVYDKDEIVINTYGYHDIKVSRYYYDDGIKVPENDALERLSIFIMPLDSMLEVNESNLYFEYFSSADALIDYVEHHMFRYKNGYPLRVWIHEEDDKNTIKHLIEMNYNKVVNNGDINLVFKQTIKPTIKIYDPELKKDIYFPINFEGELIIKSANNPNEGNEIYTFEADSNKNFVLDYADILDPRQPQDPKIILQTLGKTNSSPNGYDLFGGVKVKVQKGKKVKYYTDEELLEENSPFAIGTHKYASIEYIDILYKTNLTTTGTLNVGNNDWEYIADTNCDFNVFLKDYNGKKINVSKNIYIAKYNSFKTGRVYLDSEIEEIKEPLKLDQFFYIDSRDDFFKNHDYKIRIKYPAKNIDIYDYEGVTGLELSKYRVKFNEIGTYTNDYQIHYKTSNINSDKLRFERKYQVVDKNSPNIITKYSELWLDDYEKRSLLDNYKSYVRVEDNDKVDYDTLTVELSDGFYASRHGTMTVRVSDVSGNESVKVIDVYTKVDDKRSKCQKGWDTFCYNWGKFFRKLFGIEEKAN